MAQIDSNVRGNLTRPDAYTSMCMALGIADLAFSYLLFSNQQYFSAFAMVLLFVLAAISSISFLMPHLGAPRTEKARKVLLLAFVIISAAITIYEIEFSHPPPGTSQTFVYIFALVLAASLFSVGSFLALELIIKRFDLDSSKNLKLLVCVSLASLIVAAAIAYLIMYNNPDTAWRGIDELAYNYYSAYLFVHGGNPYVQSMQPITSEVGITPSVQLNGQYEYSYDYPALSFLAYIPLILLGVTSFFSFIGILIFIYLLAGFILYHESGYNRWVLAPIIVWLITGYSLASVVNSYLAIAIFMLIAYIWRRKPGFSGILIGLACSTTQVAWFAVPFFFILTYRELGRGAMFKQLAAAAAVFAMINIYFIVLSPSAIGNIFTLFGTSKLIVYGTNIMQYFVAFYPISYLASAVIAIIVYAYFLAIFSLYTKSLKPLIAIVPAIIFFFSWRSITVYGLPYVMLILAVYYTRDWETKEDLLKSRKPIYISAIAIVIAVSAIVVYSHQSYVAQNALKINSIVPILQSQPRLGSGYFSLSGLLVNVTNSNYANETVSFYIISRSPNNEEYILGSQLPQISARSSYNYTLGYQLPLVGNTTQLFVMAFSENYTVSAHFTFSNLSRGAT
jgi:uncharacterized membrane protein